MISVIEGNGDGRQSWKKVGLSLLRTSNFMVEFVFHFYPFSMV